MKLSFFLSLSLLLFGYNVEAKQKKLNAGHWHTEFQLAEGAILPISFLIDKEKQISHLYIINADELIELTEVSINKDSIFISFSTFDSELRMKVIDKDFITGVWINHAKPGNYQIPFWSRNNSAPRFNKLVKAIDVIGKWEVTFDYFDQAEKALGVFEINTKGCAFMSNDIIKGTFLTETGDYRYLSGVVSSDSLYLSTFDGTHAFLFKAQMKSDTLWGEFYSGTHYKTNWFAVRNSKYSLNSPDSLTYLITESPISFKLPDLDKKDYNFPNKASKNKVTLIQIMGTWCPNCLDESKYLAELNEKYPDQLNIISVTFETQKTLEEKIAKVDKYKTVLGLDWIFLIGGGASKKEASEIFPMLNDVISFPTLIIMDKKGDVRKIHTGFSGPGTGQYYLDFLNETNSFIDGLIQE